MSKTKRVTQHANHNTQLLRSPLQTDISVRALTILRHALFQEEGWPRVHAAEALLAHGYHENIAQLFSPLADTALLAPLLHGDESEVRMAAAAALLRIAKEKPSIDTCPPCKATTNTEKN